MPLLPSKIHLGIYGVCVRDGKVLMIRKGRGPYKGLLDLPGGRIEPGEGFEEALGRELDEETGAKVLESRFLCVSEYRCEWVSEGEEKAFHHVALYYEVELDDVDLKEGPDGHDSEGAVWVSVPVAKEMISPIACKPLEMLGFCV